MDKRLKQIKGRLNAATEDKWYSHNLNSGYTGANYEYYSDCIYKEITEFISNSKEDIQYLLKLVEQLQNESAHHDREAQKYFDMLVDEQRKALRYKEALEFYADNKNYEDFETFITIGDTSCYFETNNIEIDNGSIAEKALEEK